MSGELQLILGCMYSGKSSCLINKLLSYKSINKKVYFINSVLDTRNTEGVIQTHNETFITAFKTDKLENVCVPYNINVIGIDEAQFFPDLVQFVDKHLKMGMTLIVAGLDGDYRQNTFGDILSLIPKADKYDKLYAFCKLCNDGTHAPFTKRIIASSDHTSDQLSDQIMIGAENEYIAVCRFHL